MLFYESVLKKQDEIFRKQTEIFGLDIQFDSCYSMEAVFWTKLITQMILLKN